MTVDGTPRISIGIVAAVLLLVAIYYVSDVLAPLALAFFIIAIVWPLQQRLQSHVPALVALAFTIVVTAPVCLAFASLAAWSFSRVGRSLVADAARYQTLYDIAVAWLEDRGASIAGLWAEHFNTGWALRAAQRVTGRVNTTLSFWLTTLVYIMLGLLEVGDVRRKVEALGNQGRSPGSPGFSSRRSGGSLRSFSITFPLSALSSRHCFQPSSRWHSSRPGRRYWEYL